MCVNVGETDFSTLALDEESKWYCADCPKPTKEPSVLSQFLKYVRQQTETAEVPSQAPVDEQSSHIHPIMIPDALDLPEVNVSNSDRSLKKKRRLKKALML